MRNYNRKFIEINFLIDGRNKKKGGVLQLSNVRYCFIDNRYIIDFIVFAHADVTPPVGPPYWITASGLYPLLPCKLAKFSN